MARRAEIGGADIWQVEEITQKKPLSAITNDVELLARLPKWLFPRFIDTESQVDIVSQSWIVIIDGRVVMRGRQLLTVDEELVRGKANEALREVVSKL